MLLSEHETALNYNENTNIIVSDVSDKLDLIWAHSYHLKLRGWDELLLALYI